MPPKRNIDNHNNGANNPVDEQQEARMNEIDDILSSFNDDQIPPQPEHPAGSGEDRLIDVEQQKIEENKENEIENNEAQQNEEEVQLGEGEGIVDLDLGKWDEATNKQVKRQVKRVNKDMKLREEKANSTMLADRLNTFNGMFRTNLDYNDFTSSVTNAWLCMKSEDKQVQADGKGILGDLFKTTLSDAFAVERRISYKEHRLPDYAEIIRSANELLRVAMYTQTDLYAMENSKELFDATALGGLSAKEMAELATGDVVWGMQNMSEEEKLKLDNKFAELSPTEVAEILSGNIASGTENMSKEEKLALANTLNAWDLDQKSDAAWEIQSAEARDLVNQWFQEEKPFEKMINEMNALAEGGKNGMSEADTKKVYNKLAAAEWMLMQDEKMMVDDPEDPYNPIPNWGNRYWKALVQAREALNIPKHTSMRELIQNDYAAMSKAAYSTHYNERQINEQVLSSEAREMFDSMEAQKSEFKIQREAIRNTLFNQEPRPEDKDPNVSRYPYPVKEENEYEKHRNAKKENNFIKEKGPQEKMVGIDK